MRAAQGWDGFRGRVSKLESTGTGITDVSEVSIPVHVVGYDVADTGLLRLCGIEGGAAAGEPNWVGVIAKDRDAFLEQALSFDLGGGPNLRLLLGIARYNVEDDTIGEFHINYLPTALNCWTQPPQSLVAVGHTGVGPQAPPLVMTNTAYWFDVATSAYFERPGLLIPAGNVVTALAVGLGPSSIQASFVLRET